MKPYRPKPGGKPDCGECEREECINRDRFQRDRRDLSVTSGRCPRLPDEYGECDPDFYDLAGDDEAEVIRIIQILFRCGDSLQDIAKVLNMTKPL